MKKRFSDTCRKTVATSVVLMTLLFSLVGLALATRDTDHKKDQTLRGSSRINPSTLAMEFSLPLGVYSGRAGNSIPVALSYSSKVWTMRQSGYARRFEGGSGIQQDPWRWTMLESSRAEYGERTTAGWTSSLQPVSIISGEDFFVQGLEGAFPTQDFFTANGNGEAAKCVEVGRILNAPTTACPGGVLLVYYECPAEDGGGGTFVDTICLPATTFLPPPGGGPVTLPLLPEDIYRTKRIRLQMPDGSNHEFRKDDAIYNCSATGGCTLDQVGNYLSVDGSGMRLSLGENINGVIRHVLYPGDGSRYTIDPQTGIGQDFIDRNGNKTAYSSAIRTWTDTMGRQVTDFLPYPPVGSPTPGPSSHLLPSMEGQPRSFIQKWQKLKPDGCMGNEPICVEAGLENVSDELYYDGNNTSDQILIDGPVSPSLFTHEPTHVETPVINNQFYTVTKKYRAIANANRFNPVVLTEVMLPNGKSYKFRYNRYGEITKIIYPTGSYERFRYDQVPSLLGSEFPYSQANRGVVERWISSDGVSEDQHWSYSAGIGLVDGQARPVTLTIEPDGTRSERFVMSSGGAPLGFEEPRSGMPLEERVYSSLCTATTTPITTCNDHLIARSLTEYVVEPPRGPNGHEFATRDARPKKSISISFEPGASAALARLNKVDYDSHTDQEYFAHLNPNRNESYHYKALDLSTARTASLSTIAALFGPNDRSSVVETTYSYDYVYKARGILGRPIETKILDPTNESNILSKKESIYDETAYFENSYSPPNWADPGSTLRGNVTTVRTWIKETDSWIESHTMSDNLGNVRKVWDASGDASKFVETQYSLASGYAFPVTVISPAPAPGPNPHVTNETTTISTAFDTSMGVPTTSTDEFGQTVKTEFNDPLLRPKRVFGFNFTAPEVTTSYDDDNLTIEVAKPIGESGTDEVKTYMDSLGRVIKTRAKDSQGDVFVDTHYDSLGRVDRVTNPYRIGDTVYWNKTRYDELGRAVETYAPAELQNLGNAQSLGVTSFGISTVPGFIGTYVTTTDASGRQSRSITNALGQLIRVDEAAGTTGVGDLGSLNAPSQATSYTYDAYGNMVRVQQGNQSRYFKYDSLGRLLRVNQPEQNYNPNLNLADSFNISGQWTAGFAYDVVGNVVRATDANGVNIINEYDRANRVTKRCYTQKDVNTAATTCSQIPTNDLSTSTPTVNFYYDGKGLAQQQSPNYAKGKLTKVDNGISQTENMTFDNLGRLTRSRQITDGVVYGDDANPMTYEYTLAGALKEEKYPSGRVVRNAFETDGDLLNVTSAKTSTAAFITYVSDFLYTASGGIKQMKLGNGRWENAVFNTRNQVEQLGLGNSATDTSLWRVDYSYGELDSNGNVDVSKNTGNIAKQTLTIPGTSFVQSYKYDPLYRLREARETTGTSQTNNWIQNWTYDRYGNRASFTQNIGGNTTALNPPVDPNRNRFTSADFIYDGNGNVTRDRDGVTNQLRTFVFNADNKQTEVRDANNVTIGQYFYDGEGKRVKKVINATGETTVFVYSAGKLIAEYSTASLPTVGKINYTTTDHLGSPRVITDQTGQVTSRRDFLPFGEDINVGIGGRTGDGGQGYSSSTDKVGQKFTGYQKDTETSLDFAEARMYENRFGRFTAVDPLLASGRSANPQTFNRFVYCNANPILCVDPTGLDGVIWAYRNVGGGTAIQSFKTREDFEEANKVFDTEFCKQTNQGCGDHWQKWEKSNFFIWEDRSASRLNSNGTRTDFSLSQLDETSWSEIVSQFRGSGFSDLYQGFLEEQATGQVNKDWQDIQLGLKTNPNLLENGGIKPLSSLRSAKEIGLAARAFLVGPANELKALAAGTEFTVHHAGQAAVMDRLIFGYNRTTGPAILVPGLGHTRGAGVLSRNTNGFSTVRDLLARDIRELRRVYPQIHNSDLKSLIELNRRMYPNVFLK